MLEYNEIKPKKFIVLDNEPFEVLSSQTKKKNRQKPSNQTVLKNLISGSIVNRAFRQSDKVEEANIDTKLIKYIYNNKGEWIFSEIDNPSKRFSLSENILGVYVKYLKENTEVNALTFNDSIIGIKLPPKIDVKVIEAPPNIRGNTSQGGTKRVVVETGATVTVPLFIEEGNVIKINTETGEYTERIEK